ncbi:MAG: stage V sporulation protein D, partial [Armatimonadetes bacterium]|nr:stage V sporulation protein D [Armatimonadota bacterium]
SSPQRSQKRVSGTGIEYYWDNVLGGRPGKMEAEVDARGNPIPNGRKRFIAPVEGKHVILTIDDKIQFYTEQALQKTWERYHPNWVTAIAMCPKTGEILAMATRPGFDANHILPGSIRFTSNPAVGFPYEPGSTFKIVTASAVLQDLPPEVAQKKFNCSGTIQVGKHTIHCWILAKEGRGHGPQDLADGIKNSCNIAMVGFSKYLGPDRLHNYARLFGVAERTGLGCPYEQKGDLPATSTWDSARLANISFGQSLTVTPIQLLRAVSTIANGGEMMQPFIVRELRSQEGDLVQSFHPKVVRQVVTRETARKVAAMMERVVSEGTGKLAAVPGYHVSGKTGSAQKVEHGVYARGKFVSSFVGFLPAEDPKIAVLVVADEPKGSHWGSVVCGPAFSEIASKSMMRLKVEPALIAERPPSGSDSTP